LLGKKKSRDHVIVSSGWRHTRRVTFPGGARHVATNQRIALGAASAHSTLLIASLPLHFNWCGGLSKGEHLFAVSKGTRQRRCREGEQA
jgi:hypothetical protein